MHNKRLTREIELLVREKYAHTISAGVITVEFETEGIYAHQRHSITICATGFPLKPPRVSFNTVVWHPNISITGQICMDILKDQWSPALSFVTIIKSLQILLDNPNRESVLNSDAVILTQEEVQKKYTELNAGFIFMTGSE